MRRRLLVVCLGLNLCARALAEGPAPSGRAAPAAEPTVPELRIEPRAIESPALKYRLLPTDGELKPGSAAPILLRMPWENSPFFTIELPKYRDWDELPLSSPQWKKFRAELPFFDEMKRAAFRRDAGWEYPIGEQPGYSILLPDIQGLRLLVGYGISAKVRRHLLRGEFDQAREGILVGLANSRHIAQTPFFVNQNATLVISNLMVARIAEMIGRPNSPNLYWALSTLPDAPLELKSAALFEGNLFVQTFPAAGDLDRPRSADEWKKMWSQLSVFLTEMKGERGFKFDEAAQAALVRVARAELPGLLHLAPEKIAAMSDAEVSIRWCVRVRVDYDHRMGAIVCLAPREAWSHLEELQSDAQTLQKKVALMKVFEPSRFYFVMWSLNRRIAALRIVEAVRDHLAHHENELPKSLTDIQKLPIPLDPLTGEKFEWQVEGNAATLRAPPIPLHLDAERDNRVEYRLIVSPPPKR